MEQQTSFRRIVGWLAIFSMPLAFTNFALNGIASGDNSQEAFNMYLFITVGEDAGQLMKWSWLADMFGYYLLLVPAIFMLHHWLKIQSPYWMTVYTFCGLLYILCGSIGAAILAKVWPTLIAGYAEADEPIKEIYRIVFTNSTEMVYGGIWGYLEFFLAGIWWIGIGVSMKSQRKALGLATIILGIFTLASFVGEVFEFKNIALIGLLVYLLFAPVWAFWLGITFVRGKEIQLETL